MSRYKTLTGSISLSFIFCVRKNAKKVFFQDIRDIVAFQFGKIAKTRICNSDILKDLLKMGQNL